MDRDGQLFETCGLADGRIDGQQSCPQYRPQPAPHSDHALTTTRSDSWAGSETTSKDNNKKITIVVIRFLIAESLGALLSDIRFVTKTSKPVALGSLPLVRNSPPNGLLSDIRLIEHLNVTIYCTD